MSKVKPIPEGSHTITAHLICKNAAEAIEFYKKAFGAQELYRMHGPDGKTLVHAEMRLGDSQFMLADEMPDWKALSPTTLGNSPVSLHVYVEDVDAAFDRAVKAGAQVAMPLSNMFWGDRYGKLVDPFGHQWSMASHIEDVSPEEMQKRGIEAMKQMAASRK